MIRDMNPKSKKPTNAEDNLCVFLKGAPDRVHIRCNTIIEAGEVVPMTDSHISAIESGNTLFGNMGERVLGFSRLALDPKLFKKTDMFGTKEWKAWATIKEYN
jgi:magnesium-transporting ATPase (P-type)